MISNKQMIAVKMSVLSGVLVLSSTCYETSLNSAAGLPESLLTSMMSTHGEDFSWDFHSLEELVLLLTEVFD